MIKFYKHPQNEILSDFIHLITNHSHQIDEIYDEFQHEFNIKCNINSCKMSSRHNRNRNTKFTQYQNDNDLEFEFIRDLFDSIHCYILHQYDYGFRVNKNHSFITTISSPNPLSNNEDNNDESDDSTISITDIAFKKLSDKIKQQTLKQIIITASKTI